LANFNGFNNKKRKRYW